MKKSRLILTCEHGGNEIPSAYKHFFIGALRELQSHKGYDPGALSLFQALVPLADFSKAATVSRLLVELNRSLHHPRLFSDYSKKLKPEIKKALLEHYYFPYRNEVEKIITKFIQQDYNVIHLSVHTFTPQLNHNIRKNDFGILYDPSRKPEKVFCGQLRDELLAVNPEINVRFNYPYRGTADGFTTFLRKKFRKNYLGIEIEVNQKHVVKNELNADLKNSIQKVVEKIVK